MLTMLSKDKVGVMQPLLCLPIHGPQVCMLRTRCNATPPNYSSTYTMHSKEVLNVHELVKLPRLRNCFTWPVHRIIVVDS